MTKWIIINDSDFSSEIIVNTSIIDEIYRSVETYTIDGDSETCKSYVIGFYVKDKNDPDYFEHYNDKDEAEARFKEIKEILL